MKKAVIVACLCVAFPVSAWSDLVGIWQCQSKLKVMMRINGKIQKPASRLMASTMVMNSDATTEEVVAGDPIPNFGSYIQSSSSKVTFLADYEKDAEKLVSLCEAGGADCQLLIETQTLSGRLNDSETKMMITGKNDLTWTSNADQLNSKNYWSGVCLKQ